jgi:hypothetical protein
LILKLAHSVGPRSSRGLRAQRCHAAPGGELPQQRQLLLELLLQLTLPLLLHEGQVRGTCLAVAGHLCAREPAPIVGPIVAEHDACCLVCCVNRLVLFSASSYNRINN